MLYCAIIGEPVAPLSARAGTIEGIVPHNLEPRSGGRIVLDAADRPATRAIPLVALQQLATDVEGRRPRRPIPSPRSRKTPAFYNHDAYRVCNLTEHLWRRLIFWCDRVLSAGRTFQNGANVKPIRRPKNTTATQSTRDMPPARRAPIGSRI